jgi:hypothetical protein
MWLSALVGLALAKPAVKAPEYQPAASAAEMPVLRQILEGAGWTPTPSLSGVYGAGRVFEVGADGVPSLYADNCIDRAPLVSSYTSAEVVGSMQAGVGVVVGGLGAKASASVVKKLVFGAPEQHSIPGMELELNKGCAAKLAALPEDRRERLVVVREALVATIAEQTCGTLDASGRFVVASAETSLSMACSQESLEPVVVGYRLEGLPGSGVAWREKPLPSELPLVVGEASPPAGSGGTGRRARRMRAAAVVGGVAAALYGGAVGSRLAYDGSGTDGLYLSTNGLYLGAVGAGLGSGALFAFAFASPR